MTADPMAELIRQAIAGALEHCNAEAHGDPGQISESTRTCTDCATAAVVDLFRGPRLRAVPEDLIAAAVAALTPQVLPPDVVLRRLLAAMGVAVPADPVQILAAGAADRVRAAALDWYDNPGRGLQAT